MTRFLESRPIIARPLGALGRGWRWCARNRAVASLLATVFLVLVGGVAASTWLWRGAEYQRGQAEANFEQAEENFRDTFAAVDQSFIKVSEERLLNEPGMMDLRKELLLAARPFFEKFVATRRDDPKMRRELAVALVRLATVSELVDPPQTALALWQDALPVLVALQDSNPDKLERNLIQCYLSVASCLQRLTRLNEAEDAVARAKVLVTRFADETVLVDCDVALARTAEQRGDRKQALAWLNDAVERSRKQQQASPQDVALQEKLVVSCLTRANFLYVNGQHESALADLQEAQKVAEALLARPDTNHPRCRRSLAALLSTTGMAHYGLRRFDPAREAILEAHQHWSDLVHDYPRVPQFRRDLASNLHNLGTVLLAMKRLAEVEEWQRSAVAVREQLHREQPENAEFALDLANSYRQAAILANHRQQREDVLLWNGKAIEVAQDILRREEQHAGARLHVAGAAGGKAQTLTQLGRHAESLEFWDLALKYDNTGRTALLQTYRAVARAATGAWRQSDEDVRAVLERQPRDSELCYHLACARALAATAVARTADLDTPQRQAQTEAFGRHAIELLGVARAGGFFNDPANANLLRTNAQLDSLRERSEFQAFLEP